MNRMTQTQKIEIHEGLLKWTENFDQRKMYEEFRPLFEKQVAIEHFRSPKHLTFLLYGILIGKVKRFTLLDYGQVVMETDEEIMNITEFKKRYLPEGIHFRTLMHMLIGPVSYAILLSARYDDFEITDMAFGLLRFRINGKDYEANYFDTKDYSKLIKQIEKDLRETLKQMKGGE